MPFKSLKYNWVRVTLVALLLTLMFGDARAAETEEEHDTRMAWWRDARFGMFIHWGLYSAAGGEWKGQRATGIASGMMMELEIPPDEYAVQLLPLFTAERFDPAAWAALAKRAGMKYGVMTSKHHEGFALFDSALTDYDIMASGAQQDVIRGYLDAFRAEGLKVGLYHSVIDWHHPDYPVDSLHPMRNNPVYTGQTRVFSRYVDFLHGQVAELTTNYGPIDILWWDFSYGVLTGEAWRAAELINMVKANQPAIILNNRLYSGVTNDSGDFSTPEQTVPAQGLPNDWETCMTINATWGYKPHDLAYKSSIELIRTLAGTASKGGNLLLNVGPRADGSIPQPLIERLEAIGMWMDIYSESIYTTSSTPFKEALPWGCCTTGKTVGDVTKLYLHVFDWPLDRQISVPLLDNTLRSVYLLGDTNTTLTAQAGGETLKIDLPWQPIHEADTVVVLEINGAPALAASQPGEMCLDSATVDLHGTQIRIGDNGAGISSIGAWMDINDWVSWTFRTSIAGAYEVYVTYGCEPGSGGTYSVAVGQQILQATSQTTTGWFDLRTDAIGQIELPANEDVTLAVRILAMQGVAPMDLRSIELKSVDIPAFTLLGDYPLGEDGTLDAVGNRPRDSSPFGRDIVNGQGASVGAGTRPPEGSKYLNFDGTAYYYGAVGLVPLPDDNYGFDIWARVSADQAGQTACIAALGNEFGCYELMFTKGAWALARFGLAYIVEGAPGFLADTWTHLAVVRDGGVTRFFINGVEAATDDVAPVNNGYVHLGIQPGGLNIFRGDLDHMRVFQFKAGSFDPAEYLLLSATGTLIVVS